MSGSGEHALEEAEEALRAAEELGDDFSLAQAWNLLGRIEGGVFGAMASAERAWRQALSFAERGDYAAEKAESIGWLLHSTIFGPLHAVEGIARSKEFQDLAGDDPTIEAWCCVERSVLEAMRGEFDLARELLADGTRALADAGLNVWAANTAQEAFLIESLAGTPEAATQVLRSSYATLDQMGTRGFSSTIAGFLAQALYAQGDYEEAGRFSRASEMAAAPDDAISQMLWRTSRAKILARNGELERAEVLAREAVRLGEPTDLVNTQADALFDLAEVLALAERGEDALAALEEAERLYEAKGNLMALERARSVARELAAPSSSA
jgi:tetratricopeptide (TPR) repeat protein